MGREGGFVTKPNQDIISKLNFGAIPGYDTFSQAS
jgi:hypothetical protein